AGRLWTTASTIPRTTPARNSLTMSKLLSTKHTRQGTAPRPLHSAASVKIQAQRRTQSADSGLALATGHLSLRPLLFGHPQCEFGTRSDPGMRQYSPRDLPRSTDHATYSEAKI